MLENDVAQSRDEKPTYRKTTVIFPADILRDLRRYLVDHDLTSHDQSRIIVAAIKKFLEDEASSKIYDISIPDEEDFQKNTDDDLGITNLSSNTEIELGTENQIAIETISSHSQKDQKKKQRLLNPPR